MSERKTKYKLFIFGEATKKWRRQGDYDSFQAAKTRARHFESLSYKVQIRRKGKILFEANQ